VNIVNMNKRYYALGTPKRRCRCNHTLYCCV